MPSLEKKIGLLFAIPFSKHPGMEEDHTLLAKENYCLTITSMSSPGNKFESSNDCEHVCSHRSCTDSNQ